MRCLTLVLLALLFAPPAYAQDDCRGADCEPTEAERTVQKIIAGDGVHVVRLWAPWCHNSINEMRAGLAQVVEDNPDVSFTFVTIYNDGRSGRGRMNEFDIPERVRELTQPDYGRSGNRANRRRTFIGLPITWTPTTWIFNRNGKLAYASNFGELTPPQLQNLIEAAKRDWSH